MMEKNPPPSTDATDQVRGLEEKPVDPMEVFSRQLEDIINTYGSACSLMEEKIAMLEKDEERLDEANKAKDLAVNPGVNGSPETEQMFGVLLEELGKDASPEEKLETVLRKYAELLKEQMSMQDLLKLLQEKQGVLVKQRDQLQIEHSQGILARSRLESLCRELHKHNMTLKEEMLHKCQEDEKKRAEITSHFQTTVVDIQAQIEQHSNRNNKLCHENNELANKLTSIIQQYEKREESLEKLFKQKSLQQQLSDTKLEEANLALKEAGEKHMREKEYLLKDAIEKTKKCFTLKEQELQMKKQLVLYSQKFDEFQTTLAKSNEVYVAFKQEMEKMSKKMKKLEKESNVWKIRFESCNKALTDMIEERSEKGKELEMFTVKIDKLETLCRALQEERKVLYEKIKDIRLQTISASEAVAIIVEEEIPELNQLTISETERNPALTSEMEKLWKEQARLEEFAASLIASTSDDMEGSDSEEEPSEPAHPIPVVPVPNKTSTVNLTEERGVDEDCKEVHKEVVQLEANQQEKKQPIEKASKAEPPKAEPPKAEPPKVEPPKAESPKAQPSKEEPPEAEPPKAEPPKVEPSKVESSEVKPNVEPPKVEPPKVEPPKAESPKAEPPKAESPKEKSPKVEPPKVEPSKAEPPKVEPSKAETFKVDPPKAETSKAESPKAEPPKVEPPKVEPSKAEQSQVKPKIEPPKEEPPNAELPKAEPPKVEPSIAEPIKAESQKAEPTRKQQAKQETPKKQQSKAEPSKEVLTKGPSKKAARPEGNKQHTPKQKPNRPNSVEIKEPKSKEVKPPTVPAQAPEEPSHKNELHPEQEPMTDSGKESQSIQVESPDTEPPAHEVSTGASGSQNPKPSQEATPTPVNKPHPKKQGGAKKKGAPKSAKKS